MESKDPAEGFNALLGKALLEPKFREQLLSKDRGQQLDALAQVGIKPTEDALANLNDAVDSINKVAAQFGGEIAAA